jgi:hypothetical protein
MQSRWARRVFVAARVTRADRQALNEEGHCAELYWLARGGGNLR